VKVRPITVMAGLAAIVALAAVTVSWRGTDSTRVVQPAALPLALEGSSLAGATSTMAPAIARLDRVTYVRGPGLADLSGTRAAWVLRPGEPDRTAVARLARALGVTGALVDRDGEFVVGDSAARSLQVSRQGGASWYLSDFTQGGLTVSGGCAQTNGVSSETTIPPDSVPLGPATTMTAPAPASGPASTPPELQPPTVICMPPPAPPAPEGVPDGPAAEAAARLLLADAGIDLTHVTVSVSADAYSAVVRVGAVLDDTPVVELDTTVAFGAKGAVVAANGWLGDPVRGDQYPLIGVDAAIARLQTGDGQIGIQPMMGTADSPATTGTMPATPSPGVTAQAMPIIPQPRDITVTIAKATVVLAAVPGTDGSMWLVPAYHLEAADGGSWTVLAIDPSYIAPPPSGPPAKTVPPVGSGSSSSGGSSTPGSSVSPGNPGQIDPSPPSTGSTGGSSSGCVPCPGLAPNLDICCQTASTTTSGG